MTQLMAPPCERCGRMLDPGARACRNCGALAYRAELERLSAEAIQLEPFDPMAAALRWRRCLDLLPPDAPQYAAIYHRLGALASGFPTAPHAYGAAAGPGADAYPAQSGAYPGVPGAFPTHPGAAPALSTPDDPPLVAVLKTGVSMVISILAYAMLVGGDPLSRLMFATGFVVLILIHELGHVAAMRYYGLSASPPIFIPFLGAMIRLRQQPPDAKVEAVVGIGGPVAGAVGVLACYGVYLAMPTGGEARNAVALLAELGILLNILNLLPVPPLDGGRVTAALSPKIWMLGLIVLVAMIAWHIYAGRFPFILVLVLLFALPRVRATLANRAAGAATPYYAISRAARGWIAVTYVGVAVGLCVLWYLVGDPLNFLPSEFPGKLFNR